MEKTELAFRLIDTDDDGYIDKSEFIKFSKNLSKEQVEKAWAKLDKDGDGRISISEFNDLMNKKKNPKWFFGSNCMIGKPISYSNVNCLNTACWKD